MRRDRIAKLVSYIVGAVPIVGLVYFARIPKPAALDFRAQAALSQFAFWMALVSGVVAVVGFFRQENDLKVLTIVFGLAMCFLWMIIAAGHLPVA